MPAQINTYPRGLLGLLDAKTGGQTPQELVKSVQPNLDMWKFYYAQERELLRGDSAAIAGLGVVLPAGGLFTVPDNEIWVVGNLNVQINVVQGAGDTVGLCCAYQGLTQSGLTATIILTPPPAVAGMVGVANRPTAATTQPFMLLPGEIMAAFVYSYVASVNSIRFNAEFIRFPI